MSPVSVISRSRRPRASERPGTICALDRERGSAAGDRVSAKGRWQMARSNSIAVTMVGAFGLVLVSGTSEARAAAGCDNGVPVGGTACAHQGDPVQYRCQPGSQPGQSNWSQESCNGGTCQGRLYRRPAAAAQSAPWPRGLRQRRPGRRHRLRPPGRPSIGVR